MTDAEDVPRPERPSLDTREVTDPRELRALAHPVRLALLEVLAVEGALTATQAGELIGESPTTCSFHFRQLAKYGFVEEAGGGAGRNRPWKRAHLGDELPRDRPRTPRQASPWRLWRGCSTAGCSSASSIGDASAAPTPRTGRRPAGSSESAMYVTTDELRELTSELLAILARFTGRLVDPSLRPPGSRLVEVLAAAYPVAFGQSLERSGATHRRPYRSCVMRNLLRNRNARRYLHRPVLLALRRHGDVPRHGHLGQGAEREQRQSRPRVLRLRRRRPLVPARGHGRRPAAAAPPAVLEQPRRRGGRAPAAVRSRQGASSG